MADFLECVGALLWIALAVYTFLHTRRMTRRLDDVLDKFNDQIDAEYKEGNGPW